jgi:2-oxoglutarate-Fe(II)-dependent oxygenase superfamily protein
MSLLDRDEAEIGPNRKGPRKVSRLLSVSPSGDGIEQMAAAFQQATPFPHIVLENFLTAEAAEECLREFPSLDTAEWVHYTHVNERKFARSDRSLFGPVTGAVVDELNSPTFLQFLERLTGIRGLLADEGLMGGGLHQSGTGGFLNIHADFTGHPHRTTWRRRINLLVYLNRDWKPEYGGDLELWAKDMERCERKIAPVFNRAVIFQTDVDSFHGHPDPMTCPSSTTRKSLALYYFTEDLGPFLLRSTRYRPRPGDGARAVWIHLDGMALRLYDKVKRTFKLPDSFAGSVLRLLSRTRRGRGGGGRSSAADPGRQ